MSLISFFFVLLFNLSAHTPRYTRSHETIKKIKSKNGRQDIEQNIIPKHDQRSDEEGGHDRLGKGAGRAQSQRFEARVADGAYHHRRKENQDGGDHVLPGGETLGFLI